MVVIAALFIAFAVIAAVAVERNTVTQQITRRDATQAQLDRLANAILDYATFSGGLFPCPAQLDLATTDGGFGSSVNTAGTQNCSGTDHTSITRSTDVVRGMVPVQTLSAYGIGINEAFDPWNNRIFYAVNRQLTTNGSRIVAGNPTLTDARTGMTLAQPDFILFSVGKDGLGGFKRSNASTTPDLACAASTVLRLENCDGDATFLIAPTFTDSSATAATYFDDIIVFYRGNTP
jgi:hypothetical protein